MKKVIISYIFFIINLYSQPLPEPVIKQNFPVKLCDNCRVLSTKSPLFYDIDGDSIKELIIATGSCLYILKNNGENLPGWPKCYTGEYIPLGSGAAIGDVDGDGNQDIVFITQKNNYVVGSLHILDKNGKEFPGFPVVLSFQSGFFKGPALYDINNDGKLEIILRAGYGIYIFNYKGNIFPGWPQLATIGDIISAPLVSDIDFDGEADIFAASVLRPHIDSLKRFAVYAWNTKGELKPGWPFIRDHRYFNNTYLGAIARFPEDSVGVIVFASTRYPPIDIYEVYALNGNAELLPGWPQRFNYPFYSWSGIVLLDYFREKMPEAIVLGDQWGYYYTWDMSGSMLPKFPVYIGKVGSYLTGDVVTVPLLYHDIENREFVMIAGTSITENDSGFVVAMRSDSTQMQWSPLKIRGWAHNSAGFSDLESDGNVELAFLTLDNSNSQYLYVYEFLGIQYDKRRFPWPVTSANRWNTGEFGFEPTDTVVVAVRDDKSQALETKLYQNYPNPFNTSTRIKYELDRNTSVKLSIYNVLGQLITTIVDAYQKQGRYEAVWDARKYPSGVYYVKLETGTNILMSKVLYVR